MCFASGAAEDNAVDAWTIVGNTFQSEVFVAGMHHIIDVPHVFGAFVARTNYYFLGVVHVVLGNSLDFGGHCGREQQHFAVVGHIGENLVYVVDKSHVKHFVGFVENHGTHHFHVHCVAFDEVEQSTRCGNYDVHAAAQHFNLAFDARAAIYGQHAEVVDIFRVVGKVAGDLQTQFASWRND